MLIELPDIWIAIINIVLWFIIHMSFAYFITIIPIEKINPGNLIYHEFAFERNGKVYEVFFKIKSWKDYLPDGAALFKKGFKKKRLAGANKEYIERFVIETCRGELVHWLVIVFSPIFFIWNPPWAGIIMIIYAFAANLPCILAQRYNRIRMKRLINRI